MAAKKATKKKPGKKPAKRTRTARRRVLKKKKPARTAAAAKKPVSSATSKPDLLLISIIVVFILLVLGSYAYLQDNPVSAFSFLFATSKQQTFAIEDKCTEFFNNIIHTVQDDGDCQVRCSTQCIAFDQQMESYSFQPGIVCHSCTCMCR